ncbi:MAG: phosphomethylpyrimidine synthase ThiC [Deltaproteobacteria bacterium]|nr:phosphomethylpyrimidine synthase ThiC [Deltaproteobacteria bacterium]
MTQMRSACKGVVTEEIRQVARNERIPPEALARKVAEGRAVVLRNRNRRESIPIGIGEGLSTKINANIGTSRDHLDADGEIEKARAAVAAGADTIMDLSTGGDLPGIRRRILREVAVPLGTVPIYEAALHAVEKRQGVVRMDPEDFFDVIERQGAEGVDYMTVHCGVTLGTIERLRREGRLLNVVSRGGSFLLEWMIHNGRENPLYEQFDRLLEIAVRYDICLSLGDGMRPGCLADATDRGQVQELIVLGELTKRAREAGVQVMIEGPGHVPINQVEMNIKLEKELCDGAPFYVLGPLVTDIAPGYDHITSAIGGAIAGAAGADFLCYVTPAEHLRLPTVGDVREGVIAAKIAAHAADIAKGIPGAMERDREMARARRDLDWDAQIRLSLDPEHARKIRESSPPQDEAVCSMCGEFCAIKGVNEFLGETSSNKS